ncbi:hypothetical protein ES703_98198 [subsurface metagenome]
MKPYAERGKKFEVQTEGRWTEIYSVSLQGWLAWMKAEVSLDPELQGMILRLNAHGFITEACCAGHDGFNGYIAFYGEYTEADIAEILRPYYMKITSYVLMDQEFFKRADMLRRDIMSEAGFPYESPEGESLSVTNVGFEGIGQSKRRKRSKGKQLAFCLNGAAIGGGSSPSARQGHPE